MNGSEKWLQNPSNGKTMRRLEKGVIVSLLASTGSFLVIVFSFLLPSFQEQYDRLKSHEVVDHYEKIGKRLFKKDQYSEAEMVFERAFELSESRRLDLDIMRLKSRVFKVYENEAWVRTDFEEISEGDFLFLIESTKNKEEMAMLKSAFGTYLALKGEKTRALGVLEEARKMTPNNPIVLVNLGNVYSDLGDQKSAILVYENALKAHPDYYEALYDLGVLYFNSNDCTKAKTYLKRVYELRPDKKLKQEFKDCL